MSESPIGLVDVRPYMQFGWLSGSLKIQNIYVQMRKHHMLTYIYLMSAGLAPIVYCRVAYFSKTVDEGKVPHRNARLHMHKDIKQTIIPQPQIVTVSIYN